MKLSIFLFTILLSKFVLAQGLIFAEDRDRLLDGPEVLKLAVSTPDLNNRSHVIHLISGGPHTVFSSPIKGLPLDVLNRIKNNLNRVNEETVLCSGVNKMLNGEIRIQSIDICIDKASGRLLYSAPSLGPDSLLRAQVKIQNELNQQNSEVISEQQINNSQRGETQIGSNSIIEENEIEAAGMGN